MKTTNNKNKNKRMVRRSTPIVQSPRESPGEYTANLHIFKKFRFISGTGDFSITPAKLGSLICTAVTTTSLSQWFDGIRIIVVQMWAPATSATSYAGSINFGSVAAGNMGPNIVKSSTAIGTTHNLHVKRSPDPHSQAAQWQNCNINNTTAQQTILSLHVPNAATVVEVSLEATNTNDARTSTAAAVTVTGPATTHQVYWMALDNSAGGTGSSTNLIIPDASLITIT